MDKGPKNSNIGAMMVALYVPIFRVTARRM